MCANRELSCALTWAVRADAGGCAGVESEHADRPRYPAAPTWSCIDENNVPEALTAADAQGTPYSVRLLRPQRTLSYGQFSQRQLQGNGTLARRRRQSQTQNVAVGVSQLSKY
jgi:hypothetical protein